MSWRDDPITEKQEALIAQIEEDALLARSAFENAAVAYLLYECTLRVDIDEHSNILQHHWCVNLFVAELFEYVSQFREYLFCREAC